jgi:beta-lactamase class A
MVPRPLIAAMVVGACGVAGCHDKASNTAHSSTSSSAITTTTVPPSTTTTAPVAARATELQLAVDGYAARQPVPFSIVVEDLATGARAERSTGRVVLSASLYKLFVARELLRRVADGELRRDAPAGDANRRTVGACIEAMIVVSDNACGQAGLRMVGGGALDARLARDGFPGTRLASPQRTTAADVARFLLGARDGTLLAPGHEAVVAELYGLLRRQQVNDRLPLGLPAGTPIAHKTGDRVGWAHDAGVVTSARGDFLLVVLTGPWAAPCCDADHPGPAEQRAFGAIAGLAREVFALESR